MISVSDNFKEAIKNPIRQLVASFDDGVDEITESDDLKSLKYSVFGDLGKAIMRQCQVTYYGSHTYTQGNPAFGVKVADVVSKGNFTVTIANPAVVTLASHGLSDGNRVKLSTTGELPTGLSVDTSYYVIKINDNTFKLATTFNNAMNNIAIVTTGSQSGTHSLDYYVAGVGSSSEEIDLGTFYVHKKSVNIKTEETTIYLYDKMYEALVSYETINMTYPTTLKQFLQAICTDLNWTLATTTFPNDDTAVESDHFAFTGKSYRDVLNQIAEASGTIMYFNNDDELVLKSIGGASVESITASELFNIDLQEEWGDINSIVIANSPVDTNWTWYGGYYHEPYLYENTYPILLEDDTKLRTEKLAVIDGLYQIRLINNQFTGEDQETYMTDLVTALMEFSYIPFSANTSGLGYLEIGDTITLIDHNETSYETTLLNIELELSVDGLSSTLSAQVFDSGITNEKEDVDIVQRTVQQTIINGENLEDDSVPSTKVKELAADKITTGSLQVGTEITIVDEDTGEISVYIANVEE